MEHLKYDNKYLKIEEIIQAKVQNFQVFEKQVSIWIAFGAQNSFGFGVPISFFFDRVSLCSLTGTQRAWIASPAPILEN